MGDQTTPVTVLSGALGAGKTTVLNHVLSADTDRDLAVLVNDMGEVNVDADLVAESSDIANEEEELIELSNGCICCELRGDLLDAVGELSRSGQFDAIIVESTGVAEPLPVAQTLTLGFDQADLDPTEFHEETGLEPLDHCRLDTTVTVVDAHRFTEAMASDELLDDEGTEKHLGDLLVEQIEFCDVLVVNKCDLVDEETLAEVEATLERLQPRAKVIRTTHGRIEPDAIVETGLFDFEEARTGAGWIRELQEPHASAEEEHGVTSFVLAADRPFHPERFADLLDAFPDAVVRAKGHFWLAGREEHALSLNVAGQSIRIAPGGRWVAALPPAEREAELEAYPDLKEAWDEEYGDRGTRLVLIGVEMDHDVLRGRLEDALLTDAEMDADWSAFTDRFPTFEDAEPEATEQASAEDPETEDDAAPDATDVAEEVGIAE